MTETTNGLCEAKPRSNGLPRIAIIYHYFPHYRAPILRSLSSSVEFTYKFFGALAGSEGIQSFNGDRKVEISPIRYETFGKVSFLGGYQAALRQFDPQVLILIGNPYILTTWWLLIWSRLTRRSVVMWAHGWIRGTYGLRGWLRNLYFGLADGVFVYSDRAVDLSLRAGFKAGVVTAIYNSLDWELAEQEFANLDDASLENSQEGPNLPDRSNTFIQTARLTAACRFDLLLDAAALLKERGRRVKLTFVGEGPCKAALERQALALGIEASFLGAIYEEQRLAELLYSSVASVHPGKIGLAAIHSLSYGTPVITHSNLDAQMPEVEILQDEVSGYFFRQGSVVDLADAMERAIDDPRPLDEIRDACRSRVRERYTPDAQRTIVERQLTRLINNRAHAIQVGPKNIKSSHRPSRIVYVCHTFGRPDHDRCNALADAGVSVTVIDWSLSTSEYIWESEIRDKFEYYRIEIRARSIIDNVKGVLSLLKRYLQFGPDLTIIYGYQNPAFYLLSILSRISGKYTISMNDSRFRDYNRDLFREFFKKIMLIPYQGILVATREAEKYARYLGTDNTAIYYCAIDLKRVVSAIAVPSHAVNYSERPFIVVSRLVEKKNLFRLLQAFELYAQSVLEPRKLIIVGYGPLEEAIADHIRGSDTLPSLVEMRGYVPSYDIPDLLNQAFCLILPSTTDQFGIVVVEALACGIPVIVSSECGASEIIDPWRNGFIVPPENVRAMSKALMEIDTDEANWNSLRAYCRQSAWRADIRQFVASLKAIVPDYISRKIG